MKKIYITFGGSVYDATTKKIVTDGPRLGADEVWVYDDVWVTEQDFYRRNAWLWNHHHKRGFGWYAWKPFIILDALSRLQDGDVVMYTDADTYPIADFSKLYEIADKEGIMLFEANGQIHRNWCKRDCYIVMNQDDSKYYDVPHGVARFMLFKKGAWGPYQFLMEWLTYCVNERATTFDPSILGRPELEGFIEHRAEQAIMTNLAHKYGYKLYRGADEIGEKSSNDRDLYGELFTQRNDFVKKVGVNITAPVKGSVYRHVPDPRIHQEKVITSNQGMFGRKISKKYLVVKNAVVLSLKKNSMKILFRITPRKIKDVIKKKQNKR